MKVADPSGWASSQPSWSRSTIGIKVVGSLSEKCPRGQLGKSPTEHANECGRPATFPHRKAAPAASSIPAQSGNGTGKAQGTHTNTHKPTHTKTHDAVQSQRAGRTHRASRWGWACVITLGVRLCHHFGLGLVPSRWGCACVITLGLRLCHHFGVGLGPSRWGWACVITLGDGGTKIRYSSSGFEHV